MAVRKCIVCGTELTEENTRELAKVASDNGENPRCIDCEQEYFNRLEKINGTHIALYLTCAAFCVPCEPLVLTKSFADVQDKWIEYLNLLEKHNKYYKSNTEVRSFFDGETDIRKIFGRNVAQADFGKYVEAEKQRLSKTAGTPEQRERWGTIDLWLTMPMTNEIYDELDRQYSNREQSYKGQTITAQMEDILIRVTKLSVASDRLMAKGDYKAMSDIQKTIDSLLASEQMRKKDEKPTENYRLDAHIFALEKLGFVEDGKFKSVDEVQQTLFEKFVTRKKYGYPLDVCDQMIADMWNTMRINADAMISTELPEELQPFDDWGEFAEEESEETKRNKNFAGLTKVQYGKNASET